MRSVQPLTTSWAARRGSCFASKIGGPAPSHHRSNAEWCQIGLGLDRVWGRATHAAKAISGRVRPHQQARSGARKRTPLGFPPPAPADIIGRERRARGRKRPKRPRTPRRRARGSARPKPQRARPDGVTSPWVTLPSKPELKRDGKPEVRARATQPPLGPVARPRRRNDSPPFFLGPPPPGCRSVSPNRRCRRPIPPPSVKPPTPVWETTPKRPCCCAA